jgi:heat shock transcription factor
MPQAGSRKRQAPGASPVGHNLAQPAFRYNQQPLPGNGDSFLSWDQKTASPEDNNMSVAPDSFNTLPYDAMAPQNFRPEAANQLARRPVSNQMVPRVPYNGSTGDAWPDMMLGQERQSDSSWQDDDALLDQRALEAKKAAQNSRKSIPPFVQKLSRYVWLVSCDSTEI